MSNHLFQCISGNHSDSSTHKKNKNKHKPMSYEQQETKKNNILLSTSQEKGNDPLCHHRIYLTHSCENRKKICSFLRYPSILNTLSEAQLFSYMYRIKKKWLFTCTFSLSGPRGACRRSWPRAIGGASL